ncbi:MAG: DVU3141 family protein [Parvibaculum sp.]|uniref:DVU3141 family protein n=1 Tax=Parvibaculum sp. TaxID=2024848 RepID=UPI002717B500|nr:DVU3141 family protein [Parvibaculum sp.]MDO8838433.1 DVU3141 family protein [Parvibaculum sp.]
MTRKFSMVRSNSSTADSSAVAGVGKGKAMRGFLAALILSVGLAACETMPTSSELASADAAAGSNPTGDSIALYAVNAAPGSTGPVVTPSGNNMLVHVGADYVSATGDRCRRVILADDNGRSQVSAVCLTERSWKTVVGL